MAKKMKRILLCTSGGSFKQWVLFTDGSTEWGPIGKSQRPGRGSDTIANQKIAKHDYTEMTEEEYANFKETFKMLCDLNTAKESFKFLFEHKAEILNNVVEAKKELRNII